MSFSEIRPACLKTGCSIYVLEHDAALWGDLFHIQDNLYLFRFSGDPLYGKKAMSRYREGDLKVIAKKVIFVDHPRGAYGTMLFRGLVEDPNKLSVPPKFPNEIYQLGRDSYDAGVGVFNNPYTPGSADHNSWKKGWCDGVLEKEKTEGEVGE